MTADGKAPCSALGMNAVLAAQFYSALADNAVLIAAIALLRARGAEGQVPLMQAAFIAPFIALAPFAGPLADGFPKGRVMLLANLVKLSGAAAMVLGMHPVVAYGLIGAGAAVYSPAKYGILSQLVDAGRLVRANGLLEGSTIVAILLGVVLGGWLTDHAPQLAFAAVLAAYVAAAGANLFIPRLAAERPLDRFRPGALLRQFLSSLRTLFSDGNARFSLLGTGIFWGSGITLRILLFAWAPAALTAAGAQTPANLLGIVSLGIIAGAAAAGAWITLETTNRSLIGGLLLGPAIAAMAGVHDLAAAAALLALIGFCGGLFVVPLNALLQAAGHRSVGAGNALAVQNFSENLAMLLFMGLFSAPVLAPTSAIRSLRSFGLLVLLAVSGAVLLASRQKTGLFLQLSPWREQKDVQK